MLVEIYTAVKNKILAAGTTAKDVQWFNMQYDATITTDNLVMIEFPDPIPFDQASNQTKAASIRVRIHIVNRFLSIADGSVPDDQITAHEVLASAVKTALDRFRPADGSAQTFQFMTWQHWHRQKGLMITFVDFKVTKQIP